MSAPICFEVRKPGGDILRIQVLEDGRIRTDTGIISGPNHANAEAFLRELSRLAGGTTEIKLKGTHAHIHAALEAHASDGHTH